jgi:hypothetical protein
MEVEPLVRELATMDCRPRAVLLSPKELNEQAIGIIRTLGDHEIEAWVTTLGSIHPDLLCRLAEICRFLRVTTPLTTIDADLQGSLEPGAPAPSHRLRQAVQLHRMGICSQVSLDPLLPGITDSKANLDNLLEALAEQNIKQVTATYLVLRDGMDFQLRERLGARAEPVLAQFAGRRYLPRAYRQRAYASLMARAAGLGISVKVCQLTNPDFGRGVNGSSRPLRSRLAAHFRAFHGTPE